MAHLGRGAQEFGWEDQRWTLARVARVIEGRYGVRFTVPGGGTC